MARLAAGTPLSPAVLAALRAAIVERGLVRLPQLDHANYDQADAVLVRLGGRWNRSRRAHVWPDGDDPTTALAAVVAAGVLPEDAKRRNGWFATPRLLANNLAYNYGLLGLDMPANQARVLEPSAGEGALADALREFGVTVAGQIVCIEPDPYRAEILRAKGYYQVFETRFQDWAATVDPERFDLVLMNPPFTEPGDPLAWITHIELAWQQVANGGRLVAVVPAGLGYRNHKRIHAFRRLVERYGEVEELPADSFKESGTGVRTALVVMDGPLTAPLHQPVPTLAKAHTGTCRQLVLFELERHR